MAVLETLVTGVGAAVANTLIKMWLKDEEVAAAAAGEVSKILIKKIPDFLKRDETESAFRRIRNISADSIHKMLQKEAEDIALSRKQNLQDS